MKTSSGGTFTSWVLSDKLWEQLQAYWPHGPSSPRPLCRPHHHHPPHPDWTAALGTLHPYALIKPNQIKIRTVCISVYRQGPPHAAKRPLINQGMDKKKPEGILDCLLAWHYFLVLMLNPVVLFSPHVIPNSIQFKRLISEDLNTSLSCSLGSQMAKAPHLCRFFKDFWQCVSHSHKHSYSASYDISYCICTLYRVCNAMPFFLWQKNHGPMWGIRVSPKDASTHGGGCIKAPAFLRDGSSTTAAPLQDAAAIVGSCCFVGDWRVC